MVSGKKILVVGSGPGVSASIALVRFGNYSEIWCVNDAGRNIPDGVIHNVFVVDPVFWEVGQPDNLVSARFNSYLEEKSSTIKTIFIPRTPKIWRKPKDMLHGEKLRCSKYFLLQLPELLLSTEVIRRSPFYSRVVNALPTILEFMMKRSDVAEIDLVGFPFSWHEELKANETGVNLGDHSAPDGRERRGMTMRLISWYFQQWSQAFAQMDRVYLAAERKNIRFNNLDKLSYLRCD